MTFRDKHTVGNRFRFTALLLPVLVLLWTGTALAQEAEDEFGLLSSEAARDGKVAILATGWHPITGDEPDLDAGSGAGGMVAVTGDEFVKSVSARGQVSNVRRFEYIPFVAMTVDAAALEAAKRYNPEVQILKDWPVKTMLAQSVPMIGAGKVHSGGYTGKGTYIAVIDTGVDVSHPFIAGRPIFEACASDRCPNRRQRMIGPGAARPVNEHGTHVAGIALGKGKRMRGVAPEAGLIAINVFNAGGRGARTSNVLAALELVARIAYSRRVVVASANLSLGGGGPFQYACSHRAYDMLARLLTRLKVAVVAASGNEGRKRGIAAPACVRRIISVGAIDKKRRVAKFSNSGRILDILAPGVEIRSSVPGSGKFKSFPGTSMAAPHVAGAFAVLRQAAPERSVRALARALTRSGRKIRDPDNDIRKPALDISRAIGALGIRTGDGAAPAPGIDRGPEPPARPDPDAQPDRDNWQPIGG